MEFWAGFVELQLELEIDNTGGLVVRDVISPPLNFLWLDFQLILCVLLYPGTFGIGSLDHVNI